MRLTILTRCTIALHIFFFFTHPPTTAIYTLSPHDALPISLRRLGELHLVADEDQVPRSATHRDGVGQGHLRSEEHTSELQSRGHLVCRLLLEKKKIIKYSTRHQHV